MYPLSITCSLDVCYLRMSDANLLIKIYHRQSRYGFCEDTCSFGSVPELVRHYQRNSLAEYNDKLNIKLENGLSKCSQVSSPLSPTTAAWLVRAIMSAD